MTNTRLDRVREAIAAAGLDGLLVTSSANRRYVSGFTGSNGWLLVGADDRDPPKLATDFRYLDQAAQESPDFEIVRMNGPLASWWGNLVGLHGRRRLGFEAVDVSVATHTQLQDATEKLATGERPELVASHHVIEPVRAIKDQSERALLQEAARLTDDAFADVTSRLEPGWSERRVAWEIEHYARTHGADAMAFESIVAAGPHGARPHAQPRDEAIGELEPIVIDMGARLNGYCSDMTRTISLGGPDERFPQIYDIVLAAHETAAQMVEPGMKAADAHQLAQRVIDEAGFGEFFGHGLGHGVGLEIHEYPHLGASSKDELAEGMVITIEPGIYLPDWGGIRIEDMGVLEADGFRSFTETPKLRMIEQIGANR